MINISKQGVTKSSFDVLVIYRGGNEIEETFAQFFTDHYAPICRHAAFITGSREDGEEIAQEVFLRYCRKPPDHDNAVAWLYKVANNLAYNRLRNYKTELKYRNRQAFGISASDPDIAAELERHGVEESVVARYKAEMVRRVLESMSPRDRMCLLLKSSGYSYGEIAEIIGIKSTSVGTIIARSRERFSKKYSREVGNDGMSE